MLPECTPAVTRALEAAQQMAASRGAAQLEPAHLLQGLLQEEEGQAAAVLRRAGVAVRPPFPVAPAKDVPSVELPLSPSGWQALTRARELAVSCAGEPIVHGEHLLLALFQLAPELGTPEAVKRLEAEIRADSAPLRLDDPLHLPEATDKLDAARIIDASYNRAREALRVLEDYCRFALDDAFLSGRLKQLRHDLTAALADLSPNLLLEARDTEGDVGTRITTAAEGIRHSLLDVARANCKRLQEALRSLEEFGKLHGATVGEKLEQLRYGSYTLERALLLGADARARLADARLYVLLTGARCAAALDWTIREAVAGGASVFQLREKELDDRQLLERARQMRRWTRETGTLFIVNDRPDIARLAEADGVHVGQDDLPVREARRILGPDALIGVSTHTLEQVRQAILDGASYIGIGPTFPSKTKDFATLAGLVFVRQALAETSLPAFVLGGVTADNIGEVVAAGGERVAVSQAIAAADDPRKASAALVQHFSRANSP